MQLPIVIRAAIADGAPLRAVATAAGLSVAGVGRIRDRAAKR